MRMRLVALVAVVTVLGGGCTFLGSASRYAAAPGAVDEPFWCAPEGGVALDTNACTQLSIQLDQARAFAHLNLHASDALGRGATASSYQAGVGAAFRFRSPTATFDPQSPDTLLYDDTDPGAQVAGIEWNIASETAPEGFTGPNDHWTDLGDGVWRLRVWALRPFQNEPNVFATSHPCLDAGGPIYDLSDLCYTSTHTRPLEILVSNDDGYNAEGIDAVVQALTDPDLDFDVHVTVSAPATNQSGAGGKTTPGGVTATLQQTLSGYPAYAANGFPADSVLYALNTLHVNPDLLISGTNNGQNIGPLVDISGTVGAARVGGRANIPSVAVSQELGSPPDYPSSVDAMMTWVRGFLFGREGPARFQSVVNINAPTCTSGSIRGTAEVPAATDFNGRPFGSNCLSTVTSFADDIDAFNNGYVAISSIGT
jgi:5'-nucleotidase